MKCPSWKSNCVCALFYHDGVWKNRSGLGRIRQYILYYCGNVGSNVLMSTYKVFNGS